MGISKGMRMIPPVVLSFSYFVEAWWINIVIMMEREREIERERERLQVFGKIIICHFPKTGFHSSWV